MTGWMVASHAGARPGRGPGAAAGELAEGDVELEADRLPGPLRQHPRADQPGAGFLQRVVAPLPDGAGVFGAGRGAPGSPAPPRPRRRTGRSGPPPAAPPRRKCWRGGPAGPRTRHCRHSSGRACSRRSSSAITARSVRLAPGARPRRAVRRPRCRAPGWGAGPSSRRPDAPTTARRRRQPARRR